MVILRPGTGAAGPRRPGGASLDRDYVQRVVRIARELPDVSGEAPRLYAVTRGAQTVLSDDCANLEQAGLRGLLRVIGAEHPYLRTTHIDVDERTDAEQVARQLLAGSDEDETAWRANQWYTARLVSGSASTRRAGHHRRGPRARRCAPADPHAR